MANPSITLNAGEMIAAPEQSARRRWRTALMGPGLVMPALVVTILFSIVPIIYLAVVSFTEESTFFFNRPIYTLQNYQQVWNRYLPHVTNTIRLAVLSSAFDLVFGYPFAYILIRRVRYRELVRTLMTFPLFGPLYLAYGISYIVLPNGPLAPVLDFLHIRATSLLFSDPMTIFGMAMFTFPFMVMNVGTALANVDPTLEEAARTLGARPWQVFTRILFPLSASGILAGFLMCFGWNLGVFVVPLLLGGIPQQRVLSLTLYQKGLTQFDYGLASAMGIVLMVLAFGVTWLSLKFSRGALGA
ncbi:MAG: putative spermidine/putrescine transport system permease protein [Thermomicrobiales bacterium]|jgi:ABC-type spermidine/putrescine transport system permease subunit I|nr:putative spermidine/putrescine transport system permease protein [Thermomicrobiales bacterium]